MEQADQFPDTIKYKGWQFNVIQTHISGSKDLQKISEKTKIKVLPEMVFGGNELLVSNKQGLKMKFSTVEALCKCPSASTVKVKMADKWSTKMEKMGLKDCGLNFDWTYSTEYTGCVEKDEDKNEKSDKSFIQESNEEIDMKMLMRQERILWFKDILLYEDELADNGLSKLDIKIRVMPSCFLIRLRFFLRVDGVIVRIKDTRYFHDFSKSYVLKDSQHREDSFEDLRKKRIGNDLIFNNPEAVARLITLRNSNISKILIDSS
mmetsp:Transcript_31104/g.75864  ORF Transcript_31104/g.75864 Transcript_31104/m.75864 type:complete len:263 (-) Transcript_31104:11-799(-)